MTLRTANLCFDCSDTRALALWWAQVLDDYAAGEEELWTDEEAWLQGPLGREIEFLRVPEGKQVKNRVHLCLRSAGSDRDTEVERVLGLGARMVDDLREELGWAVLADPEGNEFCVLDGTAESAGVLRGD